MQCNGVDEFAKKNNLIFKKIKNKFVKYIQTHTNHTNKTQKQNQKSKIENQNELYVFDFFALIFESPRHIAYMIDSVFISCVSICLTLSSLGVK